MTTTTTTTTTTTDAMASIRVDIFMSRADEHDMQYGNIVDAKIIRVYGGGTTEIWKVTNADGKTFKVKCYVMDLDF